MRTETYLALALLVAVLVGGLVGGTLFWLYRSTDETDFEAASPPTLNGQGPDPLPQCEWHAPVLNGVLYKTYAPAASPPGPGRDRAGHRALSLPKDALVALTVTGPTAPRCSENSAQRTELSFSQNGTHILRATVEIKPRAGKGVRCFSV